MKKLVAHTDLCLHAKRMEKISFEVPLVQISGILVQHSPLKSNSSDSQGAFA